MLPTHPQTELWYDEDGYAEDTERVMVNAINTLKQRCPQLARIVHFGGPVWEGVERVDTPGVVTEKMSLAVFRRRRHFPLELGIV